MKDTSTSCNTRRFHFLRDDLPQTTGLFLFGATDKIQEITDRLAGIPPILILRLRNMTAIDATGLQALESPADAVLPASGRGFILCGPQEQPARLMNQAEFWAARRG